AVAGAVWRWRRRILVCRQALYELSSARSEERRVARLAFRRIAVSRWRRPLWFRWREHLDAAAAAVRLPGSGMQQAGAVLSPAARRRRFAALRQRRVSR